MRRCKSRSRVELSCASVCGSERRSGAKNVPPLASGAAVPNTGGQRSKVEARSGSAVKTRHRHRHETRVCRVLNAECSSEGGVRSRIRVQRQSSAGRKCQDLCRSVLRAHTSGAWLAWPSAGAGGRGVEASSEGRDRGVECRAVDKAGSAVCPLWCLVSCTADGHTAARRVREDLTCKRVSERGEMINPLVRFRSRSTSPKLDV